MSQTRASGPPAEVPLGPDPGRAGSRAGAHRARRRGQASGRPPRSGSAWPAAGRPPRSSRGSPIASTCGWRASRAARSAWAASSRRRRTWCALLWIQSRMVFYIAAAHGYDPRHPMRPAELLALLELYPTPAEARQALDGMGKRLAQAAAERALRTGDRTGLHLRLARYMAKRMTRHYAGRLIPLIGAPIGALQNAGVTKAWASARSPTTAAIRPCRRPARPRRSWSRSRPRRGSAPPSRSRSGSTHLE